MAVNQGNEARHSSGEGVRAYYDRNTAVEWERLERHRTEFAVTLRALRHYLSPPPAAILDVGGGPGRYAIALAAAGYRVTLTDLSAANLALAAEKAQVAGVTLAQILPVNALDLSPLGADVYDSVLLLGPLYHLLTAVERQQAVAEARRVLKPNGILFAAFITRFEPLRNAAQGYPEWLLENREYMEQLLQTGVHDQAHGFTNAYFAHPDEIIPFMEATGFTTLGLIGCEGIVAGHEEKINALQGEAWELWVDLNYRLGQDPALRGAADHLLYIGRNRLGDIH
jgi:S-adenosylmethionine-dependent methyltransferase